MIEVNITATDFIVESSSTVENYTITATNIIFTITNTVSPTITVNSSGTNITIDTNGYPYGLFDRVQATTGTFVDLTATNLTVAGKIIFGSGASQGAFTNQGSFVNNGPVTINNTLTVYGNVVFAGTATTSSTVNVSTLVADNFVLNGLTYPHSRGYYGQVLATNGSDYANWTNLGDLVYWSLNNELLTNEYNIVSGIAANGTAPQMTIGNGNTARGFRSSITFAATNSGTDTGVITIKGSPVFQNQINTAASGIKFSDGSVITTGYISTNSGGIVPIATTTVLGVIRVGANLTITADGILSANNTFFLPAASASIRGGIRVGSGLVIVDGDVLTADYSTATIGIINLTQDAYTSSYSFRRAPGTAYKLSFPTNQVTLGDTARYISITDPFFDIVHSNTITQTASVINLNARSAINLNSPYTEVGTVSTSSVLRVQKIYNHAGTYAPTFPAGIQFPDNSVQVTAWQTSTLYQQYLDFQNPYDP